MNNNKNGLPSFAIMALGITFFLTEGSAIFMSLTFWWSVAPNSWLMACLHLCFPAFCHLGFIAGSMTLMPFYNEKRLVMTCACGLLLVVCFIANTMSQLGFYADSTHKAKSAAAAVTNVRHAHSDSLATAKAQEAAAIESLRVLESGYRNKQEAYKDAVKKGYVSKAKETMGPDIDALEGRIQAAKAKVDQAAERVVQIDTRNLEVVSTGSQPTGGWNAMFDHYGEKFSIDPAKSREVFVTYLPWVHNFLSLLVALILSSAVSINKPQISYRPGRQQDCNLEIDELQPQPSRQMPDRSSPVRPVARRNAEPDGPNNIVPWQPEKPQPRSMPRSVSLRAARPDPAQTVVVPAPEPVGSKPVAAPDTDPYDVPLYEGVTVRILGHYVIEIFNAVDPRKKLKGRESATDSVNESFAQNPGSANHVQISSLASNACHKIVRESGYYYSPGKTRRARCQAGVNVFGEEVAALPPCSTPYSERDRESDTEIVFAASVKVLKHYAQQVGVM
ncbi:MAG: hypothetical protein ACRCWR_06195 [Saezia sp.]